MRAAGHHGYSASIASKKCFLRFNAFTLNIILRPWLNGYASGRISD